jgi:hypothetical protein
MQYWDRGLDVEHASMVVPFDFDVGVVQEGEFIAVVVQESQKPRKGKVSG